MNGLGGTAYAVVFAPESGRVTALDGSARCPCAGPRGHVRAPRRGRRRPLWLPSHPGGPRRDRAAQRAWSPPPRPPSSSSTAGSAGFRSPPWPNPRCGSRRRGSFLTGSSPCTPRPATGGCGSARRHSRSIPGGTPSPSSPSARTTGSGTPSSPGSLRVLAEEGPEPFYRGPIARRVLAAVNEAGGILEESDFEAAAVREVPPLDFGFRDVTLATLPGNSGGPTLAAALSHLDAFPPAGPPGGDAAAEVRFLHLAAESLRLAFGDRFRHLGDPESVPVPLPGLLDPGYLRERRQGVTPDGPRVSTPAEPPPPGTGEPAGVPPSGAPAGDCTTHVNAMDADGMAVALTGTLGGRFGSAFAVPGLGYPLNNGMMWFDPRPGPPDLTGPGPPGPPRRGARDPAAGRGSVGGGGVARGTPPHLRSGAGRGAPRGPRSVPPGRRGGRGLPCRRGSSDPRRADAGLRRGRRRP